MLEMEKKISGAVNLEDLPDNLEAKSLEHLWLNIEPPALLLMAFIAILEAHCRKSFGS